MREFKWKRKKIYSVRNYELSLLSQMQNGVSLRIPLLPLSPHFGFIFLRASSRVFPRSPPLIARPTTQKLPTVCNRHDERGLSALLVLY